MEDSVIALRTQGTLLTQDEHLAKTLSRSYDSIICEIDKLNVDIERQNRGLQYDTMCENALQTYITSNKRVWLKSVAIFMSTREHFIIPTHILWSLALYLVFFQRTFQSVKTLLCTFGFPLHTWSDRLGSLLHARGLTTAVTCMSGMPIICPEKSDDFIRFVHWVSCTSDRETLDFLKTCTTLVSSYNTSSRLTPFLVNSICALHPVASSNMYEAKKKRSTSSAVRYLDTLIHQTVQNKEERAALCNRYLWRVLGDACDNITESLQNVEEDSQKLEATLTNTPITALRAKVFQMNDHYTTVEDMDLIEEDIENESRTIRRRRNKVLQSIYRTEGLNCTDVLYLFFTKVRTVSDHAYNILCIYEDLISKLWQEEGESAFICVDE